MSDKQRTAIARSAVGSVRGNCDGSTFTVFDTDGVGPVKNVQITALNSGTCPITVNVDQGNRNPLQRLIEPGFQISYLVPGRVVSVSITCSTTGTVGGCAASVAVDYILSV